MSLEREIDILGRTKRYMDEIAGFGLNNMGMLDETFMTKFKNNIEELRHLGFVQISDMMEKLAKTRDIKTYVQIEFILKNMQNYIYKFSYDLDEYN